MTFGTRTPDTVRLRKGVPAAAAVLIFFSSALPAEAALTISTKPTKGVSCKHGGICVARKAKAVLNVSDLTNMLATSNLTVESGAQAQDIVVDAPFSWAGAPSGTTLTLDAYRSLTVNKTVSDAGDGGLQLLTNDGGSGGDLMFGSAGHFTFLATDNLVTINGTPYALVNSVAMLANAVSGATHGNYALSTNYDASADGTYASAPVPLNLLGTFEGFGNSISNLTVSDPTGSDLVGLFAQVGGDTGSPGGGVRDFSLVKASITGSDGAGAGGLAGLLTDGAIVSHVSVSGSVTGGNQTAVGGLIGNNIDASIENSSSSASVSAGNSLIIGGLAGYSSGAIANSNASGTVTAGQAAWVGGLVGDNNGSIEASFATGKSNASGNASDIGGLVAVNSGTVDNSYAGGAVKNVDQGASSNVGGLLGFTQSAVTNSYSSGSVKGGHSDSVGGVVGTDGASGDFTDTYWDTTTSGITNPKQGAGNIKKDPGLTGLSNDQLQAGLPPGFQSDVWTESAKVNGGLPYLVANPPPR